MLDAAPLVAWQHGSMDCPVSINARVKLANLDGIPTNTGAWLIQMQRNLAQTSGWAERCKSRLLIDYHLVRVGENIGQFSCLPIRALPMHQHCSNYLLTVVLVWTIPHI